MEFKKLGSYKVYFNSKGDIYFNYKGRRYYLEDAVRCHNNGWLSDIYPEFIHGIINIFTCNAGSRDLYLNFDLFYSEDKITVYTLVK